MQLVSIRPGSARPNQLRHRIRASAATGVLVYLLATGPSPADSLAERFNDDFGDTPAHVDAAPAAEHQPVAARKLRPRRPNQLKPSGATEPDGKMSLLPTEPNGERRSPALTAIKPVGTIPLDNSIHISWNPADPNWDGMFVSNDTTTPVSVLGITFNKSEGCRLRPYRLSEVRKTIDLPQAIKVWGEKAINLFGLPKLETDDVLIPDLSKGFPAPTTRPDSLIVRPGDRIPIFNGTKCDTVADALVETDRGTVPIRFKIPYTGH
jgi:hypothetical protein